MFISQSKGKAKKGTYWGVSNSGFISIYGLSLFIIVLSFLLVLQQKVLNVWMIAQMNQSTYIETYITRYIVKNWEYHDEEYEETISYQGHEITLNFLDQQIKASFQHIGKQKQMEFFYDEICECIMDIKYQ